MVERRCNGARAFRSNPLVVAVADDVAVYARRAERWPDGSGRSDDLDACADAVLGPAEVLVWGSLGHLRRRRHWLLGRIAAKDAVRELVLNGFDIELHPADVQILVGPRGRPVVAVADPRLHGSHLVVSIAHIDEVGVAIACADSGIQGVGVDVEMVGARRGIERMGLADRERRDLEGFGAVARAEHIVRRWCAKEAVSKALGTGLGPLGGPRALITEALDPDGHRIRVHVGASAEGGARALDATTTLLPGPLVVAIATARGSAVVQPAVGSTA